MKDSSGHFNGAVFLYRLQFVCCEVIYFRKEAAELIENSLRETVKAGIKTGDLAVNHQRQTLGKNCRNDRMLRRKIRSEKQIIKTQYTSIYIFSKIGSAH